MDPLLENYFSLSSSQTENDYIFGLFDQFNTAYESQSYHLALMAYHLLFLSYFHQVLFKMKIWMPEKYNTAMVSFDRERRKQFREATDPINLTHGQNKESSMFEFLNNFTDCEEVVAKCKKLVKDRNQKLAHVNYLLTSENAFDEQINKYNTSSEEISNIYMPYLYSSFEEYISSLVQEDINVLNYDDFSNNFIIPNKLSLMDLRSVYNYCDNKTGDIYKRIFKILEDKYDFDIE